MQPPTPSRTADSDPSRRGLDASPARRAELQANLERVRVRIAAATSAAGRDDAPTLVVVTKFFPVTDLVALADLGVGDVGENREQELVEKVDALRAERPDLIASPRRHFIGQIQSKKARRIARHADVVQSLDRLKLVPLLDAGAADRENPLDIFVQVALERDGSGRGGAQETELHEVAAAVEQAPHLRLCGLMAVAPLGEEPAAAFSRLAHVRQDFLANFPQATSLSAGMSGDLEDAVKIGATHLRVGSAILGSRPLAG
ncbi:Predicted enzyme with a TIM-barrel fold [Dermacoccus nishinomiyaensis]|mgnify:FL=1|nr:YggS family pyridoxal phosphate-dependent enzyme [Dermacoccus nishinomiyaensis]STD16167.1 Predicted enzyme with a TIM-barrel fold [Dermacoccus nishinomiyaensis]